jgi:dTDP-glucose 4,6-dehydratase
MPWQGKWGFAEGLVRTVEWYLSHRPWWERVKSGEYRRYAEEWYARLDPARAGQG